MRRLVLTLLLLIGTQTAHADDAPAYITTAIAHASLVGEADFRWFGFRIYQARLWVKNGRYIASDPHALQVIYSRNFRGTDLADEGFRQMRKQGVTEEKIQQWQPLMRSVLLDVNKGDTLTVVHLADDSLRYFYNDRFINATDDAEFNRRFLDIWLGEKTTAPALRKKLIGQP